MTKKEEKLPESLSIAEIAKALGVLIEELIK